MKLRFQSFALVLQLSLASTQAGALEPTAAPQAVPPPLETSRREATRQASAPPPGVAQAQQLGDDAMTLGDYETAATHYQKALDLHPDPSTWSRSAQLVWTLGDGRKARWFMQKAIDAAGTNSLEAAGGHAQLALMLWRHGALLPAALEVEKALKLAPDDAQVLATAGRIRAAQAIFPEAIAMLERSASIAPTAEALVLLGDLYALANRGADAGKVFSRVVQSCRAPAASGRSEASRALAADLASATLARFYADHDRQLDEALRLAEAAHRTLKSVWATDTLAWCYFKAGRLPEARKAIRQALRHNTPDATLLFHAGMIHAKLGEAGAARQFLNRALSLNPRFHPRDAAVAIATLQQLTENPPALTQAQNRNE